MFYVEHRSRSSTIKGLAQLVIQQLLTDAPEPVPIFPFSLHFQAISWYPFQSPFSNKILQDFFILPNEILNKDKNITRIPNAVLVTIYSRVPMNYTKSNQCLKGHKSLESHFEGVL